MIGSMTITNAKYVEDTVTNTDQTVTATINGQDIAVPMDPANRHYAEILRQVDAGTLTIAAAD